MIGLQLAAWLVVLLALTPTEEIQADSQTSLTANAQAGETDIAGYNQVRCILDVTKANGTTPTLDVTVQGFDPGQGGWVDTSDTFTQVTGSTTTEIIDLSEANDFGRIRFDYAVGGTNPDYDLTVGVVKKKPGSAA